MINQNRNTFYLDKADKNNIYNDIYSSQSIILSAKLVFSKWQYILLAGCVTISFWIILMFLISLILSTFGGLGGTASTFLTNYQMSLRAAILPLIWAFHSIGILP